MSKKLFVGGLAWSITDAMLRAAFEKFGTLVEAKVIMDRETHRSRGFGFVSYTEEASAAQACEAMNGVELEGRAIRVNLADDTPRKSNSGYSGSRRDNANRDNAPRDNAKRDDADNGRRDNSSGSRNSWNSQSFSPYPADDNSNKRDTRRKDRKKRDRFNDDDDRW